MSDTCSICNFYSMNVHTVTADGLGSLVIDCPRCGKYNIEDVADHAARIALDQSQDSIIAYAHRDSASVSTALEKLCIEVAKKGALLGVVGAQSILSHYIRKNIDWGYKIKIDDLINIVKSYEIPSIAKQADNLIIFLGNVLPSASDNYPLKNDMDYASLGAELGTVLGKENESLIYLLAHTKEEKLTYDDVDFLGRSIQLTFKGWQKFEELQRQNYDSKKAFVAMEFVDPNNSKDYYFQDVLLYKLIPAVKQTGYELSNPLMSDPKAGNIHARLEVEIRNSRFVIAELSHHNNGAYWEAGFARGLGKPVIYMMDIQQKNNRHFDVGSDYIVFWDRNQPDDAAVQLKALVRATLFGEAKMDD